MNQFTSHTSVWITTQFEGFHCWPECPFEEVSFLRDRHRHIFHIKAWKEVTHLDRDTEFVLLKHKIEAYLWQQYPDGELGSYSCEMLAQELINEFKLCACSVSEDGENGAMITQTPI